ncbi:MAG TPA: hypothetical protein VHW23_23910 [Kofleriaceae bacterium]|nr:hypothetical protein [Kofleriaceae bacterium]
MDEIERHFSTLSPDDDRIIPVESLARIKEVDHRVFIGEILQRFSDARLTSWMFALAPYWKDLPYSVWKLVLQDICAERRLVYQFVWVAGEFLALDVAAMVASDPEVARRAGPFMSYQFPNGGPRAGDRWWIDKFEQRGIDYAAVWRRLAAEGAPMNVDVNALPR